MRNTLGESLEAARKALAVYLSGWRKRYPNAGVYIVFDGRDGEFPIGQTTEGAGIRCIFTQSRETQAKFHNKFNSTTSLANPAKHVTVIKSNKCLTYYLTYAIL